MELKKEDVKVGLVVKSFDEEENRWYKAKVIAIREEGAVFKDIDPKSSYQGMEWDAPWQQIGDAEQYCKL